MFELTPKQADYLAALESGLYPQCRRQPWYLDENNDLHCCATHLANIKGVTLRFSGAHRIVHMNDVDERTFPQIAAAIRANPERFFEVPA